MAIKPGARVRLIQPEIQGQVVDMRLDASHEVEVLIEWQEDGQSVRRWIDAARVEQVQEVAP